MVLLNGCSRHRGAFSQGATRFPLARLSVPTRPEHKRFLGVFPRRQRHDTRASRVGIGLKTHAVTERGAGSFTTDREGRFNHRATGGEVKIDQSVFPGRGPATVLGMDARLPMAKDRPQKRNVGDGAKGRVDLATDAYLSMQRSIRTPIRAKAVGRARARVREPERGGPPMNQSQPLQRRQHLRHPNIRVASRI